MKYSGGVQNETPHGCLWLGGNTFIFVLLQFIKNKLNKNGLICSNVALTITVSIAITNTHRDTCDWWTSDYGQVILTVADSERI